MADMLYTCRRMFFECRLHLQTQLTAPRVKGVYPFECLHTCCPSLTEGIAVMFVQNVDRFANARLLRLDVLST